MMNLLKFGLNGPGKIIDHLSSHPLSEVEQLPQTSIGFYTKDRWNEWCNQDYPLHDRYPIKGHPGAFHTFPKDLLASLITISVHENWRVDLRLVSGVANSKSDLSRYESFSEMATTASPEMLESVSEAHLDHLLDYREVRITKNAHTSDHFSILGWDPRVYLINSGGSHHFAAANHLAHQLGVVRHIKGTLRYKKINGVALRALTKHFKIVAISADDDMTPLRDLITQFEAPHFCVRMPISFSGAMAYLLPVNNNRSALVADELIKAGAFDVIAHLSRLHELQLAIGHNANPLVFAPASMPPAPIPR